MDPRSDLARALDIVARAADTNADLLAQSVTQVEAMGAADGEDMPDLTLSIITNQLIMWRGFAQQIRLLGAGL